MKNISFLKKVKEFKSFKNIIESNNIELSEKFNNYAYNFGAIITSYIYYWRNLDVDLAK